LVRDVKSSTLPFEIECRCFSTFLKIFKHKFSKSCSHIKFRIFSSLNTFVHIFNFFNIKFLINFLRIFGLRWVHKTAHWLFRADRWRNTSCSSIWVQLLMQVNSLYRWKKIRGEGTIYFQYFIRVFVWIISWEITPCTKLYFFSWCCLHTVIKFTVWGFEEKCVFFQCWRALLRLRRVDLR